MPWVVSLIRLWLRLQPPKMRERAAVKLFMKQRRHAPRQRELDWMERGTTMTVAGLQATKFGEGRVAFLMHGWEGRGLQMCNFIDPLLERGYCVIALDGPDHGQNEGGMGALPTFSKFLQDAIREQNPALIIAHSMGGSAAIIAASRSDFSGKIICLGGPPDTEAIFTRARDFMRLPESGRPYFMEELMEMFRDYRTDDLMDVQARAKETRARLYAVLAKEDDDIPTSESRAIIEAGGGQVVEVDSSHRSVMWDHEAVEAALDFVDG